MIEAAFTHSDSAINITDAQGVLLRVNPAYLRLYKFASEAEVLGKTQGVIRSPQTPEWVYQEMWSAISAGKPWLGEMTNRAGDGSEVHVHLTVTPIEAGGKIAGYMGIAVDRVPHFQKEWQLYQARKQAIVGILGAGLAHELNNPMETLLLDAEYIQETLSNPVIPDLRRIQALKATESILRGVDTVSKVLSHFLEFSSVEIPEYSMSFAVNELLDDCLMLMEGPLHAGGIEVRLDAEPDRWVRGNRSQLESVLFHLLSNSRAAFAGSTQASKLVFLSTKAGEQDGRVLIEYSDNSGGLPVEHPEKIFDPLYSLRDGENSGFGLALCRKILREHGGDLACESGNGGLRFKIWLPSTPPELRLRPPVVRMGKIKEELKIKVLRPIPPRISRRELGYTASPRAKKGKAVPDSGTS